MLLNRTMLKLDPLLKGSSHQNQNGFLISRSTSGQICTIRRIIEGVNAKSLAATLLLIDFSEVFDSIHRGILKEILI